MNGADHEYPFSAKVSLVLVQITFSIQSTINNHTKNRKEALPSNYDGIEELHIF